MSLEVSGLSYAYGKKAALSGVAFAVPPGRFCALLGPNGAGKSTLFALLARLFVAKGATIHIAGHDLAREPRAALARTGIVFQKPTLDLDVSALRNLLYFGALQGMSPREAEARARAALARLDMEKRAKERVRNLNGGHRRRLEIARALMHRPAVLLLDEPTVGLDAAARAAITAHVHALAAEDGLSVLWATHLVDEVAPGDQLVVLHQGRVLSDGPAQTFAGARSLSDAFLDLTTRAA